MRAKLPTAGPLAQGYTHVVVFAAAAAVVVLLWRRTRPYDVDKAVAAMYVQLARLDVACAPSREYENRHWVCLPLVLDVTTQYVDLVDLVRAVGKSGASLVAEAVTDNPNGRNLVVRVPKVRPSGGLAQWGWAAAAVGAIYALLVGAYPLEW